MAIGFLQNKLATQDQKQIEHIRRRVQEWRLIAQEDETLERIRRSLHEALNSVQAQMEKADESFTRYVQQGRPLLAEQAREEIDYWGGQWDKLNERLVSVNEALQEHRLFDRMSDFLGGPRRARALEILVLAMIAVVVSIILVELIVPLPAETVRQLGMVDLVISLFLMGEFFLRLSLADSKTWFLRRYWIDLVASIPFQQVLHFGRLARLARFARFFRFIRIARAILFIFRGADKLFKTFNLVLLKRSLLVTMTLLVVGAMSIGVLEGDNEATLHDLGDSLWWSFATVVTGGYADVYDPVTIPGRLITVGLVLLGLIVTGIFTASLTSVLVEGDSSIVERNQRSLDAKLSDLQKRLDLMASETNQGLVALETVAQLLSNQTTSEGIAAVLAQTLIQDFSAVEVSIYLLEQETTDEQPALKLLHHVGQIGQPPATVIKLGEALIGRVTANLLTKPNLAKVDLEPETTFSQVIDSVEMVCPLVAGLRVQGALQLVLPDDTARYYLYNRVPMTLAHHAALAFSALRGGGFNKVCHEPQEDISPKADD